MLDKLKPHQSSRYRHLRFVTAASLFDGHDAAINIMRRILQSSGAEVIHLGHNRSVEEIVTAALQEDVQGIAISSYQGGHIEYLKFMVDMLRERNGADIRIFAGGGGVIIPEEIKLLEDYGVTRVYSPEDGQAMGLEGMIRETMELSLFDPGQAAPSSLEPIKQGDWRALSHLITALENGTADQAVISALREARAAAQNLAPILGITGTGGAGKSSLTDELILRFRLGQKERLKIAILAVDPSRRKTGGALLGDRIRMNAINHPNIYMRSIATREASGELPDTIGDFIAACQVSDFDLVVVETPGIGQGNAAISELVDCALYVMTPEFGAQSQLEKIDMLDFADVVAINKFDRKGAQDAYRDVCKQVQRNRQAFSEQPESMPVFGTIAARFNDDGVTALYREILGLLQQHGLAVTEDALPEQKVRFSSDQQELIPAKRIRYLSEIADTVREYKRHAHAQAAIARERQQLSESLRMLKSAGKSESELDVLIARRDQQLDSRSKQLLEQWPARMQDYSGHELVTRVRDRETTSQLKRTSLSGSSISRVALPRYVDHGELLKWLLLDNLPGYFPFTAGVFAFKRDNEDPTRMFAGEGDAFRT
ncbi:MAG: cobalamin-dependent protein, partial [Gammaproteobacteria bacterium]